MSEKKAPKQKSQKEKLIDKDSIERLYLKVIGLEVELVALRERCHNYERAVFILDRIRAKLHQEGILVPEDMEGLDTKFEGIAMDIRRMEIDPSTFLAPLPDLEQNKMY